MFTYQYPLADEQKVILKPNLPPTTQSPFTNIISGEFILRTFLLLNLINILESLDNSMFSAGTRSLEERVKDAMLSVLHDNPAVRQAFKDIVDPPPAPPLPPAPTAPPPPAPPAPPNRDIIPEPPPALGGALLLGGRVSVPQPVPSQVPSVSIVELPAQPGCRRFSTKTCRSVPIVVPKKVPYEDCKSIPSVECFFVLKTVDDLECSPVR